MHDVNTSFFYSCDQCSETIRTVSGDDVAQWMTAIKANPAGSEKATPAMEAGVVTRELVASIAKEKSVE